MVNQSVLISGGASEGQPALETVKSRFGDIAIDMTKRLTFPRGLLGIPDKMNFVLAKFPSEKMQQFTLMQSLDDLALSFITLPLGLDNPIIGQQDLRVACQDAQIPEANLALLLIVSVHRQPDQVRLSVNSRAPLLIDAERKTGVQYVFQNELYKVQHMLG